MVANNHIRHTPSTSIVIRYVQSQTVDVTGEPSARVNMESITNAASRTDIKTPKAIQKLFLCQLHKFLGSTGTYIEDPAGAVLVKRRKIL